MKKLTQKVSIVALCLVMIVLSVVPAFAVNNITYVEDHSVVDCINYYKENEAYHFQIKYPKGELEYTSVKIIDGTGASYYAGQINLENISKYNGFELNYLYSDENYDYQELVISRESGSYQYTWNGAGIKIYYYNGTDGYRATNTSYYNSAEGNGYFIALN